MWRLFLFGFLFTACGFLSERNGRLYMEVQTEEEVSGDGFKVTRLGSENAEYEGYDLFFPGRNLEDTIVVEHPQGISDTLFVRLKHRSDRVYVYLEPTQKFLDSIAEEKALIEKRLALITDCNFPDEDSNSKQTPESGLEELAIYPGGSQAMVKVLSQHLHYPQTAVEQGISGKVYLKFVVNKEGLIQCAEVIKGMRDCPECDREALIGLTYLERFIPAKVNGVPVLSNFTLPIVFNVQ